MKQPLFVFDFDDTLCMSEPSTFYVYHQDGTTTALVGHLWSDYKEKSGDKFDFQDFANLKNPRPNGQIWIRYLRAIEDYGSENVWICTARGYPDPLIAWLAKMGVENPQIACMSIPPGANNGIYKAAFVVSKLQENPNIDYVEVFDDRDDVVQTFRKLRSDLKNVRLCVFWVEGEEYYAC